MVREGLLDGRLLSNLRQVFDTTNVRCLVAAGASAASFSLSFGYEFCGRSP